MKKLQEQYKLIKATYDQAFKAEDWETVDAIEDELLDAEEALRDGFLEIVKDQVSAADMAAFKQAVWTDAFIEKLAIVNL